MARVSANPDFPCPTEGLAAETRRMLAAPRSLTRPLLVLSGWRAPGFPAAAMAARLRRLVGETDAGRAGAVSFTFCNRIEQGPPKVIRAVDRLWPTDDPAATTEIDVVGISMGGLIARAAAAGVEGGRRLRIARLFTLGTPHRGARVARWLRPDPSVCSMAPGSEFLATLDRALTAADYELVCYARLRDSWVGASNTAPHGRSPIWKPGPPILAHQTISTDRLIRLDIARRLRGEPPLGVRASAPPCE
jgi:hypothetical protein